MATTHRLSRMTGRSEDESHRTATPLELFFDLSFVLAISAASAQLAHAVAADHLSSGLVGFVFSMFAIVWAWINFTWFASAYDTDDWLFRVTTMVQMVGVLVLAIGIPPLFASLEHGEHLDNSLMVAGYVIMRLAMVFQWLRAARQDPARRAACLGYAKAIAIAQLGWLVLIVLHTSPLQTFLLMIPLYVVELGGPLLAERRLGGTPWHAHHVAERHGLLAIIALGECLLGTIAALSVLVEEHHGLTVDVVVLGLAGTGLAFSMWWLYFTLPSGDVLHHRRRLGFRWGYGHIAVFMAIAATGAGLHVAAYYLEGESKLGPVGVVLATALPVAVFGLCLVRPLRRARRARARCARQRSGSPGDPRARRRPRRGRRGVPWCLLVVMLAPVPAIVSDERAVARRREAALAALADD